MQLFDPFAGLAAFCKALGAMLTSWLPAGAGRDFLAYWIYDFAKIVILLVITSFLLSLLRLSFGMGWLRRSLGRKDNVGIFSGAALGVFTPVCSCSVTPLYASLLQSGVSVPAAGAFLFAAPAVNEFAIALSLMALGPVGGGLYIGLGLLAAFLTGKFASRLGLEPCADCGPADSCSILCCPMKDRIPEAAKEAVRLLKRLWIPLLIGAGLAAALVRFNLTPVEMMRDIGHHTLSPLAAAMIGLPLDVNAASAGTILLPLARSGLPVGTLISLLMAVTLASFPEAAVLRRVIGWKGLFRLGIWYVAYTAGVGILINLIYPV